jgi:hypothetical protein
MFKFVSFVMFIFFIPFSLFSSGIRDDMSNSQNSPVMVGEGITTHITGRVVVFGSEPHTFVGIVDENETEYAVYPTDREKELRSLQGHLIEFTVILLNESQGYGSLFLKGGTVTPVKWEIIE